MLESMYLQQKLLIILCIPPKVLLFPKLEALPKCTYNVCTIEVKITKLRYANMRLLLLFVSNDFISVSHRPTRWRKYINFFSTDVRRRLKFITNTIRIFVCGKFQL